MLIMKVNFPWTTCSLWSTDANKHPTCWSILVQEMVFYLLGDKSLLKNTDMLITTTPEKVQFQSKYKSLFFHEFVFIIIVQFMMNANSRIRFALQNCTRLFVQYTISLSSLCKII